MTVKSIENYETKEWLLKKHYAKRMCSISFAFGLFDNDNILQGVCTFGSPPSRALCIGVCGADNAHKVYELNRFIINNNKKNIASFFLSRCLRMLPKDLIIVSYADTSKNHHGYIYQSTNWIYTGLSAIRTEWKLKGVDKHSKTLCDKYTTKQMKESEHFEKRDRPRKHRYIYFTGSKTQKKHLLKALKYSIEKYPKGDNINYDASYKPTIQTKLF